MSMQPYYTVSEIAEVIHTYGHLELRALNELVNLDQENYTDDELIDLHDMIIRQVFFLRNPWWFSER